MWKFITYPLFQDIDQKDFNTKPILPGGVLVWQNQQYISFREA